MVSRSVEQHVTQLIQSLVPGCAGRPIRREMDFVEDLGADSLSIVSIFTSCSEEYGFDIDELGAMMSDIRTVGDLIDAIERTRQTARS